MSEMESFERRQKASNSNSTQIRTRKEAREVKARYESLYKMCRTGLGWIDDTTIEMKVLEQRRMGEERGEG